jgi:hypothetical protein
VGSTWIRIDDRDLFPAAAGSMTGVLSTGSGVIAWGDVQGRGPMIWQSPDGRSWRTTAPPAIDDAWAAEGYLGGVVDVVASEPGYVAVGSYLPERDWTTSVVWTSADGQTWSRVAEGSAFERSSVGRVVRWGDTLLAFGCALASPTDCGPAMVWSPTDGRAWKRTPPILPAGIDTLDLLDMTDGSLWAKGESGDAQPGTDRPTILSSTDGLTWSVSTLPWLAPMRVHAGPSQLYATVPPMPTAADDYLIPGWWSNDPGIFRSTDFAAWTKLSAVPGGHPEELIAAGGGLVAAGAAGRRCFEPSNCRPAGWVSMDEGATWSEIPARTSDGRPDDSGGTITAATAIADGGIVGVGMRVGSDHVSHPAVWLLPADRR